MFVSEINGDLASLRDLHSRLDVESRDATGRPFAPEAVVAINLHSNNIRHIDATIIHLFRSLTVLDLSSNLLEEIQGLDGAPNLVELNLSNNRLTSVQNLGSLIRLCSLNVSFNKIAVLDGLRDLHGPRFSLQVLDVKGNAIERLEVLEDLRGCAKLRHLVVRGEGIASKVNPICNQTAYSPRRVFSYLPGLKSLDGRTPDGARVSRSFVPPVLQSSPEEHGPTRPPSALHPLRTINNMNTPSGMPTTRRPSSGQKTRVESSESQIFNDRLAYLEKQIDTLVASTERRSLERAGGRDRTDTTRMANLYGEMQQLLDESRVDTSGLSKKNTAGSAILSRLEKQLAALSDTMAKRSRDAAAATLPRDASTVGPARTRIPTTKKPPTKPQKMEAEYDEQYQLWKRRKRQARLELENTPPIEDSGESERSASSHEIPVPRKPKTRSRKPSTTVAQTNDTMPADVIADPQQSKIAGAANNRLIQAMEEEEKRLRANESTYAEQIKALLAELGVEREKSKAAEASRLDMEKQIEKLRTSAVAVAKQVQDSNAALLASHEKEMKAARDEIAAMKGQIALMDDEKRILQSKLVKQTAKLEAVRHSSHDDQGVLLTMERQLQAAEEANSKLSIRLLKERESTKMKLAEAHTESDIYKSTIRQLQKEANTMQRQLAVRDCDSRQQMREISSTLNTELKSAIAETTTRMTEKHREEVDVLTRQLQSTREAYSALEEEYRKGIKEEQGRSMHLQTVCTELSQQSSDQQKTLELARSKEKEMAAVIHQLSSVLKDQKGKIADMTLKQQAAFTVFEEKVQSLEDRLKAALKTRTELRALQGERASEKATLATLKEDQQRAHAHLTEREAECTRLQSEIDHLRSEMTLFDQTRDSHDQTIRIKNKMLDDQNETIRNLKQNLDNKCREHQNLVVDVSKREEDLKDRLDAERAIKGDLQQEVEAQAQLIEHLQSLVGDYKAERSNLRKELTDVSKRLRERNESIHLIEEEVARIRAVYKAKEERWAQEADSTLKAEQMANLDMKLTYEAQASRLAALERERDVMLQSVHNMQQEVEAATKQREQHEAEMRIVLSELDRQKQRMNEKMSRLKEAFSDA
ncbi:hypothetical protein HKX48_000018 [Thoreauomyces humboldtii]|nr:hypothetical protein HKX48_000018 [Thoreauomyces humboldtii]